jgi:hypothetical protein
MSERDVSVSDGAAPPRTARPSSAAAAARLFPVVYNAQAVAFTYMGRPLDLSARPSSRIVARGQQELKYLVQLRDTIEAAPALPIVDEPIAVGVRPDPVHLRQKLADAFASVPPSRAIQSVYRRALRPSQPQQSRPASAVSSSGTERLVPRIPLSFLLHDANRGSSAHPRSVNRMQTIRSAVNRSNNAILNSALLFSHPLGHLFTGSPEPLVGSSITRAAQS